MEFILIALVILAVVGIVSTRGEKKRQQQLEESRLQDARADAQRWTERLGGQVLNMSGIDTASQQAIADASERYSAANSALASAQTLKDYQLARESALEGLHYIDAARDIMGMPKGPELPALEGQRQAGRVTERRTIEFEGDTITASPEASEETPNYYPGGNVAGKPVPAGWYSTAWWAPALAAGMWNMSSIMMFSMMFSGMAGAPSAAAFEAGYDQGLAEAGGMEGAEGMEGMDGAGEDMGGDMGDMGDDGGFFGDFFGGDGGIGFDFGFD